MKYPQTTKKIKYQHIVLTVNKSKSHHTTKKCTIKVPTSRLDKPNIDSSMPNYKSRWTRKIYHQNTDFPLK